MSRSIRRALAGVLILGTLGGALTACEVPEEPASYSEQGKSTKVAKADRKARQAKKAAWKANMDDVTLGMSMAEVKALLGKPTDTYASESEFMGEKTTMDDWTYGSFLDDTTWSLSFTDGVLDHKARL